MGSPFVMPKIAGKRKNPHSHTQFYAGIARKSGGNNHDKAIET